MTEHVRLAVIDEDGIIVECRLVPVDPIHSEAWAPAALDLQDAYRARLLREAVRRLAPRDADARVVAVATADAYMAARYGPAEWLEAARAVIDYGFSRADAEVWLRSKHPRWADDAPRSPGALNRPTGQAVDAYLRTPHRRTGKQRPATLDAWDLTS